MSVSDQPKVVLVTGCSKGGIGFALCEEFAARGCIVYATARRRETLEGFQSPKIKSLVLDVLSEDDINSVVKTIIDTEGHIDILVNNAGALCAGATLDIPPEQVRRSFGTNTFSALRLAQVVVPHMARRKKGTIVNIGSISGNIPTPWNGVYAAAKAALHSLTDILWMECKPLNVNVMLVGTGSIQSNLSSNQHSSFSIPEGSLYNPYAQQMINRIDASQERRISMPAVDFAKKVVAGALSNPPPRYLTLGGRSFVFRLLEWLPRTWVLMLL